MIEETGMMERMFNAGDRAVKDVTLDLIDPARGKDAYFLDCGPGNCIFTEEIKDRIGGAYTFVADSSLGRLEIAASKGWGGACGDLNKKITYPNEAFDVIHAGQVIEHLNNTDKFVKELHRVLVPGGYIVVSTPNLASWHNILWLALGKQPHVAMVSDEIVRWKLADDEINEPKHRRIFTGEGLAMLLTHHGFKVEEIRGAGYYPLPAPLSRAASSIDRRHAVYVVIKARKTKKQTCISPWVESRKGDSE